MLLRTTRDVLHVLAVRARRFLGDVGVSPRKTYDGLLMFMVLLDSAHCAGCTKRSKAESGNRYYCEGGPR